MSRDIYDQFKAAQEALAAQKAAEEAEKQGKIRESANARLAAEEERLRQEIEKERQEITQWRRKIAEASEKIAPVTAVIVGILTAIKNQDPTIQASRNKDVVVRQAIDGDSRVYIELEWGNKLPEERGLFGIALGIPEDRRLSILDKLFLKPKTILLEDYRSVVVNAGLDHVSVHSNDSSQDIDTKIFMNDHDKILPALASSISNPKRRYRAYVPMYYSFPDRVGYHEYNEHGLVSGSVDDNSGPQGIDY